MSLRSFLVRARYVPLIAASLYAVSRPIFWASEALKQTISRKVRRNGGSVRYDGIPLQFPIGVGHDYLSNISWLGINGFEPSTWRTMRRYIEAAGTFIDIGANIGFYSVLAKKVNPSVDVFAFEPSPRIYEQCLAFHGANGIRATGLCQVALGDREGTAVLFEPQDDHDFGNSSANTLVADSWQARKPHRERMVDVTRLDTFTRDKTLKIPVIIKIDVEDFEATVLRGAAQTIAKYRPTIICEILHRPHANRETMTVIDELGYASYAITDAGCFRIDANDFVTPRTFTDFLLLPSELAKTNFLPRER
jgi:FkbM family methyltransferase